MKHSTEPQDRNGEDSRDALGEALLKAVERAVTPLRAEIEKLGSEVKELRSAGALPRVLSVDQACAQLAVGRTVFYRLLAESDLRDVLVDLPGVKGKRVDRDLLLAWTDRRTGVSRRRQSRVGSVRQPVCKRRRRRPGGATA